MVYVGGAGETALTGTFDPAPVAVAVVGGAGRIVRATQTFADRFLAEAGGLALPESDLEQLLDTDAPRVLTTLDGLTATLYAVVAEGDVRAGLITVPSADPVRAEPDQHPLLLDEPLEDSEAIVWLKDLDGRYRRVNGRFEPSVGAAADDVVGHTDAELGPSRSIDAVRLQGQDSRPPEPLELEYTVPAAAGRPAFAVLRFAVRNRSGAPLAVCGVAAPVTQAAIARAECARLMRLDRWSRADAATITAELVEGWGYAFADGLGGAPGREEALAWPELDALIAERDAATHARDRLETTLAGVREELADVQAQADQLAARVADHDATRPGWPASAQRALAGALAGAREWRAALERAVRTIGEEGGWDGVVAWSPDRGAWTCTAAWLAEPMRGGGLETAFWQHRPDVSGTEFGRARARGAASCLLELATAEDASLRAAASAGMTSAVLVPVHDGTETVAVLELLTANRAPDAELMLSLEAIAAQLGTVAGLLILAAAPRWRLGRA